MAKPRSDKLFQLIKSMKKSEKRYFKLWVQNERGHGHPKFLQLFDQIDRQTTYDEKAIALIFDPYNMRILKSDARSSALDVVIRYTKNIKI